MNSLSYLFIFALLAGLLLQWWLQQRQGRHVTTHRAAVPQAFAERITLEQHQKAADYSLAKLRLGRWNLLLDAVILLWWTLGGGLLWLHGLWAGFDLPALVRDIGFVLSVFLIIGALTLPLSAWYTFGVEARFGFNRQTVGRFFADIALGTTLAIVLGGPLTAAVLWLMQNSGGLWWLWAWTLWMAFSLTLMWAYPVFIAPLFNKFKPLDDDSLRQRIEALLQRCGFSSKGVYVMDGSKRSGHGNAYFTGFGRNKRIVFFDTLLEALESNEVEAVLAHELGHFKKRHILKSLILSAVLSLLGFALLGWLQHQTWFYQGLGIESPSPAAALVLFLIVSPVFTLFGQPLMAAWQRTHEFEADEYAVKQSEGRALIRALVKLYRDNASTLTPDPVYAAFHFSHPPAAVRIAHISAKLQPSTPHMEAS